MGVLGQQRDGREDLRQVPPVVVMAVGLAIPVEQVTADPQHLLATRGRGELAQVTDPAAEQVIVG